MLKTFLMHTDREFFVRELSRNLNEQINAVRRELENLRKIGLLRHRTKDRKKYFFINESFILYPELKSLFLKSLNAQEGLTASLLGLGDIQLILLSGHYTSAKHESPVDLLVVGNIDRDEFTDFIDGLSGNGDEIRYSLISPDNFLYRLQYNDSFILGLLNDKRNIMVHNRLKKFLKKA